MSRVDEVKERISYADNALIADQDMTNVLLSQISVSLAYIVDAFKADRKDEPQTDGILFKGNLKDGDYKLIKTTNGWVLEGNDIAYYGEPRTDCFKVGKWYSFSDYVVEMQGEVKPTAFRIMPLEHYTNQTERSE